MCQWLQQLSLLPRYQAVACRKTFMNLPTLKAQSEHSVFKSKIANVYIYVEQAIGGLKYFNILSNVMPIKCVPLNDDILKVCCALCKLLPPLWE